MNDLNTFKGKDDLRRAVENFIGYQNLGGQESIQDFVKDPKKISKVTKEYEQRVKQENNRLSKKFIPQSDNIFNFEPPEKERPKKKMLKGEYPSKHYRDFYNRGILKNQLGEKTKERKYEG